MIENRREQPWLSGSISPVNLTEWDKFLMEMSLDLADEN
jgi:hypothetical protein